MVGWLVAEITHASAVAPMPPPPEQRASSVPAACQQRASSVPAACQHRASSVPGALQGHRRGTARRSAGPDCTGSASYTQPAMARLPCCHNSPLGNSVSLRFDTSPGVSLRAAVDISGNCLSMRATTAWGNKRQRGLMLSQINNSRQH